MSAEYNIKKAGEQARREGKPISANPYSGHRRHHWWKHGWESQDTIIGGLSPPKDMEEASAWKN